MLLVRKSLKSGSIHMQQLGGPLLKNYRINATKDHMVIQRLKEAAEEIRINVSSSTQTDINLPCLTVDSSGPKHMNLKLTHTKFENLTGDLNKETIAPRQKAVQDIKVNKSDIGKVLLVGGLSKIGIIFRTQTYRSFSTSTIETDEDYRILYLKEKKDHDETKNRCEEHFARAVKAEEKLRASEVYVLLLGTRKRVDNIEKMLAPPGIILSGPRKNRWEKILAQKDNKLVEVFRSEMKKIGLQEGDLSVALSIICQDANERSAHFNIPLPDAVDDSSIESALKIMGIRPDAPLKKAYKLIIQPLKDVPDYFDDD